ncbi:proliferating cell nuclear antigen (pcna) [Candidatus Woesearchaeota archaeon]|nr:proliferating cell nuclear antigen (pcna) [Candidatus Woesearchaeota archaeon]
MKLTLAEPKYLKDSISIISELVNEARFKVTSDAIELIAMDPANVAMVVFKLLSSTFVEYKVEEDVEIAVNLSNLKQVMRRAKPNDTVSLELSKENKLDVIFKSNNTRKFSLPIIELEEKEQKEPNLNFPISITTSASNLSEAVEDVDIVAESVSFIGESSKLVVSAEGDLSKAMIEIKKDKDTEIVADTQDKIKAKYSIEYLKKMVAGSKLADTVSIRFNRDYPLLLEFKTVDKVLLKFILAPRVEND